MRDPRFNMEIRGMQMDAEAKLRTHPGHRGKNPSVRSLLIKLFALIALVIAFFWWVST